MGAVAPLLAQWCLEDALISASTGLYADRLLQDKMMIPSLLVQWYVFWVYVDDFLVLILERLRDGLAP